MKIAPRFSTIDTVPAPVYPDFLRGAAICQGRDVCLLFKGLNHMVEDYTELIARYIQIGAWNWLDELDVQALPILEQYAVSEQDEDVRAILVEAVWQYRRPESIPFLAQMLKDPSKKVWKAAIDGLVTFGTDDALLALKTAKARTSAKQLEYIDEAIDQLENPEAWPGIK